MPWRSYEEIVENAVKWLSDQKFDGTGEFANRYEAIDFYMSFLAKIALAGDISVLHRLREDLKKAELK